MIQSDDKEILIRYRLEQAHEALREAELLRANSNTTLGAVNRAYYSMFYAVLALLQRVEKVPRKHSGAIALFDSEFVRKGVFSKELSSHLHQAFAFRQSSDYHTSEPVSIEKTDEIIHYSMVFLKTIEAYLKGSIHGYEA
jgi:uncharacterized protein (UPF0332 family)